MEISKSHKCLLKTTAMSTAGNITTCSALHRIWPLTLLGVVKIIIFHVKITYYTQQISAWITEFPCKFVLCSTLILTEGHEQCRKSLLGHFLCNGLDVKRRGAEDTEFIPRPCEHLKVTKSTKQFSALPNAVIMKSFSINHLKDIFNGDSI